MLARVQGNLEIMLRVTGNDPGVGLPRDNVPVVHRHVMLQKEGNGYELLRKSQVLTSSLVILILPETREDLTLGCYSWD